jgi:hypothetical protein
MEVDPADWDALLRSLGVSDVYYSRGYVEASAPLADGEPVFLHHGGVVFPVLLRRDPVDVVTPYGYGGPLGGGLEEFGARYEEWCAERGVVTSFAVHHPLLVTEAPGFHVTPLGGTIAWPLEGDLLEGMHKHHRRVVRRALDSGLEAGVSDDLPAFVALYEETMRRAGAAPFYFFSEEYWRAFDGLVPTVQVDVRRDGELLGSVLGMGEPPLLHYHLGGTADAGRDAGASHVALYTLARWGAENGYEVLHLGGGVGGRADSLLEFKRRFAPHGHIPSSLGKAVHDLDAYGRLTGSREVDWDGFFPAYRRPR